MKLKLARVIKAIGHTEGPDLDEHEIPVGSVGLVSELNRRTGDAVVEFGDCCVAINLTDGEIVIEDWVRA